MAPGRESSLLEEIWGPARAGAISGAVGCSTSHGRCAACSSADHTSAAGAAYSDRAIALLVASWANYASALRTRPPLPCRASLSCRRSIEGGDACVAGRFALVARRLGGAILAEEPFAEVAPCQAVVAKPPPASGADSHLHGSRRVHVEALHIGAGTGLGYLRHVYGCAYGGLSHRAWVWGSPMGDLSLERLALCPHPVLLGTP